MLNNNHYVADIWEFLQVHLAVVGCGVVVVASSSVQIARVVCFRLMFPVCVGLPLVEVGEKLVAIIAHFSCPYYAVSISLQTDSPHSRRYKFHAGSTARRSALHPSSDNVLRSSWGAFSMFTVVCCMCFCVCEFTIPVGTPAGLVRIWVLLGPRYLARLWLRLSWSRKHFH